MIARGTDFSGILAAMGVYRGQLRSFAVYSGLALFFSLISVFQGPFAIIGKIFIAAGGWALGYHSMGFRDFPDFS